MRSVPTTRRRARRIGFNNWKTDVSFETSSSSHVAMDYEIHGGQPLEGQVKISGAKNATLPLIAATLLTRDRLPAARCTAGRRSDDDAPAGRARRGDPAKRRADLTTPVIEETTASYDWSGRARLRGAGLLLARRRGRVSLPGGCAIGARPVDQHLKAMERLGAKTNSRRLCQGRRRAMRGDDRL